MTVENPTAKLIVDAAKNQSKEVGDGTKKIVILAGELMRQAGALIEQRVHPNIITTGYTLALCKSVEIMRRMMLPVSLDDSDLLKKIAKTALCSRIKYFWDHLAEIAVSAAQSVVEERNNRYVVDVKNRVIIRKKEGGGIKDSRLVQGIIIDKGVADPSMVKRIENAKIMLTRQTLYLKKRYRESDSFLPEIYLSAPGRLKQFLQERKKIAEYWADRIKATGANVLISQAGMNREVEDYLAKEGILAVRRADKPAFEVLPLSLIHI